MRPKELGLPEKFADWRPYQWQAVEQAVISEKRFTALSQPTGSGKSLVYVAVSQLLDRPTVVLTSTKQLQKQLMDDFSSLGMVKLMGRGNYPCALTKGMTTCDDAPCLHRFACELKEGGCEYFNALRRAQEARLVVTNYAYWLALNRYSREKLEPGLLVCDEAHDLPQHLTTTLVSEITDRTLRKSVPGLSIPVPETDWGSWAEKTWAVVNEEYEEKRRQLKNEDWSVAKDAKRLYWLRKKLRDLADHAGDDGWVIEADGGRVRFGPLWPLHRSEQMLFVGIPKVLLVSATVRPKTLHLLGVSEGEFDFFEYPSTFPSPNRPVIYLPTVRMNYRTKEPELKIWLSKIDNIIRTRLHEKGVIHTVSYERCRRILESSKYGEYMISHGPSDLGLAVREFLRAAPPRILVSPSVVTGYDFPHDACRWQIIAKVPYPDMRDPWMKKRAETDEEYAGYLAMQALVQAVGRGVRAEDDWCETFVVDDTLQWFLKRYRQFAPEWFLEVVRREETIPEVRDADTAIL